MKPSLVMMRDDGLTPYPSTVKPVLSGHLKIDKTNVLMENDSL